RQSAHQPACRHAAASAVPRRTENREAVDPKAAQGKGRRSAPLGDRPKVRIPGCEPPKRVPPGAIRLTHRSTMRIPPIRLPTGLPRSGGLRVAPPNREPRSGGSQGSPGEGPKVRTPGWEAEGPHLRVASRRTENPQGPFG